MNDNLIQFGKIILILEVNKSDYTDQNYLATNLKKVLFRTPVANKYRKWNLG